MKRAMILMVAVGSVSVMGMGASLAAPPPQCSSIAAGLQYKDAYAAQARRLENLFENNYGCLRLEAFMRDAYNQSGTAGITDPCRAAGIRDAATETVKKISDQCLSPTADASSVVEEEPATDVGLALRNQSCAANGTEMGKFAAQSYCASFRAYSSTGGACTALASYYCESAFRAAVNADDACRAKAFVDPNYAAAVKSACAPAE